MTVPYRPFAVRLADRERIGASFVRMTLTGDDLADCSPTLLDQRVKLLLGGDLAAMTASADWYATWRSLPDDQRPALRTYTLSAVRPEHHEVDIDVVIHEPASGPASAFAANAPLGSELVLVAGDRTVEGHDGVGGAWDPRPAPGGRAAATRRGRGRRPRHRVPVGSLRRQRIRLHRKPLPQGGRRQDHPLREDRLRG